MDMSRRGMSMALVKILCRNPNLLTVANVNLNLTNLSRNYGDSTPSRGWKDQFRRLILNRWKLQAKPGHIIPIALSGAFIYYLHFSQNRTENDADTQDTQKKRWRAKMYRIMPWRSLSRAWGWLSNVHFPNWCRNRMLAWYVAMYHVNLSEAEREDLRDYKSLADLFGRKLKPEVRIIDATSIVSPCDGIVMHFGKADKSGQLEQVKGMSYSLLKFLGPEPYNTFGPNSQNYFKIRGGNSLFFCVIYLSPGDYHGFHSPVEWNVIVRRHFRGELLSVKPSVASWIRGLFAINERVVYIGKWKHGFFSMTPVGATNVGSINVYEDIELATNVRGKWRQTVLNEKYFESPIKFAKGAAFGEFNLGSTIVLVFEAPDTFTFRLKIGQQILFGQTLM